MAEEREEPVVKPDGQSSPRAVHVVEGELSPELHCRLFSERPTMDAHNKSMFKEKHKSSLLRQKGSGTYQILK